MVQKRLKGTCYVWQAPPERPVFQNPTTKFLNDVREVEPYAVITPKGRRLLAELDQKPPKRPKRPFGFMD
jgi:hypothetical protein